MKTLNWWSPMTVLGPLILASTVMAEQGAPVLTDVNASSEISSKILMLKSEEGSCTASIVNYKSKNFLVTAAHCLPKSASEKFLNVYEGTTALLEDSLFFGEKIELDGLRKKTRMPISKGFKNANFDIFILPLSENQLASTASFEIRLSELSNQENIRPFGYPESVGPFGSECKNQGGYIAGPSMGIPGYHPVMELFCKDSPNFARFNGMSGGPVIDRDGYFVGVMSAENLSKNVGQRLNYIQIVPAVVVMDAIESKEPKSFPSFQFTDYQFSSMDDLDRMAVYSGHDLGIFIGINKLIEFPKLSVSFFGDPSEIVKVVGDFNGKDLQIEISRSSPSATSFSYEIKRKSDGQILESSTEELSISAFRDIRRWISKKVEKYL